MVRWSLPGLYLIGLAPFLFGITTPSSGAVLRGTVNITGSNQTDTGVFLYSEVSFAYMDDATGTWFLIATNSQPVEDGTLATWDTASVTDGDYTLRLRVYLQDGTTMDVAVTDLHVRNDVPLPTATPPVSAEDLPTPVSAIPTATSQPITIAPTNSGPAPLPGNPASFTDTLVMSTFRRGAIFTLIAFASIGIYLRLRSSR